MLSSLPARQSLGTSADIVPPVNLFVHWLYTQEIPNDYFSTEEMEHVLAQSIPDEDQFCNDMFLILLKAYVFGDRFLSPAFRRATSNRLSDYLRNHVLAGSTCWDVMRYAFTNIPSDRPILQHLVDDFCKMHDECHDEEDEDIAAQNELPRDFLMRVLRAFPDIRNHPPAKIVNRCYYEHTSEEEKNRCKKVHMKFNKAKECGYFD